MTGEAQRWLVLVALFVSACGAYRVEPDSHGVAVTPGPCGRGLVVVESDYQSSNVSLLDFSGKVLTPSLASSSTESAGFGVSVGSDATLPSSAQPGSQILLLDRYPASVLRFVDVAQGRIVNELSVGTGFASNPHDYLVLSEDKAYVARYNDNPTPGRQAWDAGGDVLIVDPALPAIVGRIDLGSAMASDPLYSPHPARLVRAAGRVFALLASYAKKDYQSATTSRLVEIDPNTDVVLSTLLLDGLRGCDALALAPDEKQLAIACTGDDLRRVPPDITTSGLALVDISETPRLTARRAAATFSREPVGFTVAYAASGVLLFTTLGYRDASSGALIALDTLWRFDMARAQAEVILQSQGEPFTLGSVHCEVGCGACFVADAKRAGGSVLRFSVDDAGQFGEPTAIRVETEIGLPPRYLGAF